MLQHHPYRPGAHLGGELVRCLAHQALSYLGVRASDRPGAVQRSRISCMPITVSTTFTGPVLSSCRRAKANMRCVNVAPRCAPFMAFSMNGVILGSSGRRCNT